MTFKADGYAVLRRLVHAKTCDFLARYLELKNELGLLPMDDPQVPTTPVGYADHALEALSYQLWKPLERYTNLKLWPTYTFFRIYKKGDVLHRHTDRGSCEISLSLNLAQDRRWLLYIDGFAADLNRGDAFLYRGIELPHWRYAYTGRKFTQAFLHYVDRNGPNARFKFDGRASLMRPFQGRPQ